MPDPSRRRSLWLRRGLPATLAAAGLLVVLSSLGLLSSPGTHPADGRTPNVPPAAARTATPVVPTSRPAEPHAVAVPAAEPRTSPAGEPAEGDAPRPAASGSWSFLDTVGPLLGDAGPLLRFRVAVEEDLPVAVADFTGVVDATLGDARSWIAGGDIRLQRMPSAAAYDFTIYLASPETAYEMCLVSGVDIREDGIPYTSCRAADNVIINSDRYLGGVPNYVAPLADYRQYVINHEVGHRLGHGHELCPGAGQKAPVMAQQTLGLQGCVANSWPFIDGKRYAGAPTT